MNGRVKSLTPSRGSPPVYEARPPDRESSTPQGLGPKPPPLPRSLEEALRVYPQAEANIHRYIRYTGGGDAPQFWVRMDDEIRIAVDVEDCLGPGRISSGFARTTIEYHPMPGSDSELWVDHIKVYNSNLSREELDLFMACLHAKVMHRRQLIKEDKYKPGGYLTNFNFAWPIEYTDVFQFLQTGNWPGFPPTPNN